LADRVETDAHGMSPPSENPRLSVVIPTLGRPMVIRTVESLVAARGFESLEVLVVGVVRDRGVLDGLTALAAARPQVRHLPLSFPRGDSSEKKNAGFRAARGDIVAFVDDDVVVDPDWAVRVVEAFDDPQVGLVSGPGLIPDDLPLMARLAGVALASKAAGYVSERYMAGDSRPRAVSWSRLIGCNMAYRRSVLEEIGGFDPAFWPGEEMIAAYKATRRHRLIFHPAARLHHYPRQSLAGFWKQMHGYGLTRIRLIRAGVDFEPTTVLPAAWVLSLVTLGLAAPFSKWACLLLLLDLGLYVLADALITVLKFAETRKPADLLIFFLVPVMHLSYGMAEWIELVRPNKDLSEPSAAVR
jgi:succinoglycan biosynthesis protein ExoA